MLGLDDTMVTLFARAKALLDRTDHQTRIAKAPARLCLAFGKDESLGASAATRSREARPVKDVSRA